jgi:hypothetical protein
MSEFKGTKGSWKCYRKTNEHKAECVITDTQEVICYIPYFYNDYSEANAKLISCAPEMLDMLKRAYENLNGYCPEKIFDEIEQLIKKATEL